MAGPNLRDVSADPPGRPAATTGSNGGNGTFGERLARLEAHMQHVATKAWVLGGVVGGMVLAASLSIAILKLFP